MASHHSPTFNDEEIDQFCAVTGASKDIGQHFMEACGGDMQAAVEMYLDSGSSTSTKYSRPGIHEHQNDDAGEGTSFQKNNHFNNGEVRAPIPQKKERLVEEGQSYYANARRRARPESVFDSFRNFHDETTEHSSEDATSHGRRKTLEQLFRPPIDIIFKGSFRAAMEYGATKNKWLIVNVQNVKEFSCQVLNRDVWSNSKVKELIKKRFIFWQVYSDSYEGNWYMQFYKVSSWPQVAFLDPRTGEKMLECNKIDADSFYHLAEEFLEINDTPNETPFNPAPSKKIKHSDDILEASEEKQVEAAIKASMLKGTMAPWTSENYETEESDQDDDDDDHETKSLEVNSFIAESPQATTSEHLPHTAYLGPSSDAKTKIVLRLPNGERRMLEWPCSSKLKALVAYVEENGHMGEEFQLVTNFPRRVIDTADSSQVTLVESRLHPQETVFVHLP